MAGWEASIRRTAVLQWRASLPWQSIIQTRARVCSSGSHASAAESVVRRIPDSSMHIECCSAHLAGHQIINRQQLASSTTLSMLATMLSSSQQEKQGLLMHTNGSRLRPRHARSAKVAALHSLSSAAVSARPAPACSHSPQTLLGPPCNLKRFMCFNAMQA